MNGNINITSPDNNLGPVILAAKGNINVNGDILAQNSGKFINTGSPVILNSSQGSITVGNIIAGNTMLVSEGDIIAKKIENPQFNRNQYNTSSSIGFLNSRTGNIILDTIKIRSGSIDISAGGIFQAKVIERIDSQFNGTASS